MKELACRNMDFISILASTRSIFMGVIVSLCLLTVSDCTYNTANVTDNPVIDPCTAFFNEYLAAANNFTTCELYSARPFDLCLHCVEEFHISSALYTDLVEKPSLSDCNTLYMQSDRIQIIPFVQTSMGSLWDNSACSGCMENVTIDPATKAVSYNIFSDIKDFLELYQNFSKCLEMHPGEEKYFVQNNTGVCHQCKASYEKLNNYFNNMEDRTGKGVCMDIVDKMNHTRFKWSSTFNCSQRSGDFKPVVGITCIVAVLPAFFYIILKITGKVNLKQIVIQKRLFLNTTIDVPSPNPRSSTSSESAHPRLRKTTPIS
ncbi:osteopetrosis-associated transmembrane protein 1-like isoform X2 [Physella acuta]|uniref:osteopetrosis-associated transmembrane protein 1-like isoform X2 n=1 Tax=Physella acuta TaxID=109671 RepID=UPI0027DE6FC5|nr:osteopetrosis-associated transmembrane protein 1-like isoform X2 [Physella acuta]